MNKKLFKGKWEIPEKPIKFSDNEIGQRLRYFRKSRYKTMKALGEDISVSQGALSELENGKSLPSANTLRNLYYAGCDINWLLTGEDDGQNKS